MAHTCAGRVILHSCYPYGLWSASTESTGEGGTPAFLLSPRKRSAKLRLTTLDGLLIEMDFLVSLLLFCLKTFPFL